ncbi:hypothetical protein OSTOST_09923 [Ostertagia ostertagi]
MLSPMFYFKSTDVFEQKGEGCSACAHIRPCRTGGAYHHTRLLLNAFAQRTPHGAHHKKQ